MSKLEFILGISIISLCILIWTILEPPVINSTANVIIVSVEKVSIITDIDGNVEVSVRGE